MLFFGASTCHDQETRADEMVAQCLGYIEGAAHNGLDAKVSGERLISQKNCMLWLHRT